MAKLIWHGPGILTSFINGKSVIVGPGDTLTAEVIRDLGPARIADFERAGSIKAGKFLQNVFVHEDIPGALTPAERERSERLFQRVRESTENIIMVRRLHPHAEQGAEIRAVEV